MVRYRTRARLGGVLALLCLALVACSSASAAPVRGFSLHPNWWQTPPTGATDAELVQEIQAAHSIGANVVRVPLPWNQLEPSAAGQWNSTLAARVDGIMNGLAANQMKAVVMVINTPCWASADPQVCVPFNPLYSLASAADPNDFGQAVGRIVDRWGPAMAAVEIWNEPNNPSFFHGTAADYAAMVNATATALSSRSWSGQLLAGALGMNATPSGIDWLEQLYAAGMTGEDAISIHPYDIYYDTDGPHFGDPLRPDSMFAQHIDGVRALMRAHGDASMGIWLTEFGADVCPATPICVSESDQSNWLVGMFAAAERRPFIRGSLAYSLRDTQPQVVSDMNYHFGVLRNDFSERPSAVALRSAFTSPPVATSSAPRTLAVTKVGPGSVTAIPGAIISCGWICSATVDDGSEFTLTETPGSGYRFTSWSGCSPVSANSCVVQIAGNKIVKATFASTTPKSTPPPTLAPLPPPAGSTTAPSAQPPSATPPPTKAKKKQHKKKHKKKKHKKKKHKKKKHKKKKKRHHRR